MSNDYFNHSANVISNGTRATAAQVNNIAYEIGVGLDKLPTEAHIKRGTINYAADTGSADLYAVSLPYAPAAYTDGMEVVFKAANSNTGACSMNVNSLGVKSIKRADGTDPAASEIPVNKITTLRYNSTSSVFEIQNGAGYASSAAASATAAANSAAAALVSEGNASASETAAGISETAAGISAAAAAASAATIPTYASLSGNALRYPRLAASETSMEFRTSAQTIADLGITASASEISVLHGAAIVGYNLGIAEYYGKSKSVSSQDATPTGIAISSDGTKMYVIGSANDTVYQYTLSTAWDVSTASYASKSKDVSAQFSSATSVSFSSDGTKMYAMGSGNDTVYQYTLSTAWDVSTASYASKSKSVNAQEATPQGLAFSTDGSRMYVCGWINATVYQYTLSTAWDVSTASYASKSKDVSAQEATPNGLAFSSDGTKMYVVGNTNDTVYQYSLSTAWDVSTAIYLRGKNVEQQDTAPSDVVFSADGTKMYVAGDTTNTIYQYNTGFIMPA